MDTDTYNCINVETYTDIYLSQLQQKPALLPQPLQRPQSHLQCPRRLFRRLDLLEMKKILRTLLRPFEILDLLFPQHL